MPTIETQMTALRIQGDSDHAKRPTINHPKLYLHGQIGKALNLQTVAVPTCKHPAGFDSDQFGLHRAVIDICFIQQELCRVGAEILSHVSEMPPFKLKNVQALKRHLGGGRTKPREVKETPSSLRTVDLQ